MARERPTIVIRKEEGEEPGHHGGAWKVAYADFVTAMMAFFLLMWLINATTEDQRKGLADYFAPTNLFGHSSSGTGKPFGGQTPNDPGSAASTSGSLQAIAGKQPTRIDRIQDDRDTPMEWPADRADDSDDATRDTAANAAASDAPAQAASATAPVDSAPGAQSHASGGDFAAALLTPPPVPGDPQAQPAPQAAIAPSASAQAAAQRDAAREQHTLEQVATRLRETIQQDPALQPIADQLMVDTTPEGLRIQNVDQDRRPMFTLGSATPTRQVSDLLQKVVPLLAGLPNAISIAGHTDATVYRGDGKSNWELSTERANATRHLLVDAGLPDSRIRSVTGNADRDPLLPNDPLNPANRRIAIVVLRNNPAPPAAQPGARP
jgi:chemotaxis protein MotB